MTSSVPAYHFSPGAAISNFSNQVVTSVQSAMPYVKETLQAIAVKVQELWTACVPHIKTFVQYLQTNVGTAITCLIAGTSCLYVSRKLKEHHPWIANVCTILGVVGTATSLYIFGDMYFSRVPTQILTSSV